MEKTYKYLNLKHLLGKVQGYLTLNDFISCRFHHKKFGHIKFVVSPLLRDELINYFSSALGGRKQFIIKSVLKQSHLKSYGIYNRLWIEKKGNTIKSLYCAGQDENSELNCLRQLLYKEY